MKVLKVIGLVILALFVFCVSLLFFAPWQTIGSYALESARLSALRSGFFIQYDPLEAAGLITPSFTIRQLGIEAPMALVELSNVEISARPISSLIRLGAAFDVDLQGGVISMAQGKEMNIGRGHLSVSVNRRVLSVRDAQLTGDVTLSGGFTFDLQTGKMRESTLRFTVPQMIDSLLRSPLLSRFVEPSENGEWRIRYEAQR